MNSKKRPSQQRPGPMVLKREWPLFGWLGEPFLLGLLLLILLLVKPFKSWWALKANQTYKFMFPWNKAGSRCQQRPLSQRVCNLSMNPMEEMTFSTIQITQPANPWVECWKKGRVSSDPFTRLWSPDGLFKVLKKSLFFWAFSCWWCCAQTCPFFDGFWALKVHKV